MKFFRHIHARLLMSLLLVFAVVPTAQPDGAIIAQKISLLALNRAETAKRTKSSVEANLKITAEVKGYGYKTANLQQLKMVIERLKLFGKKLSTKLYTINVSSGFLFSSKTC